MPEPKTLSDLPPETILADLEYLHVALALAERVKVLEAQNAEALEMLGEVNTSIEEGLWADFSIPRGLADRIRIAVGKAGEK